MDNPNKTQLSDDNPPTSGNNGVPVNFWRRNEEQKPCQDPYSDDAYKHRLMPINPYADGAHVYNPAFRSHADKISRLNTLAIPQASDPQNTTKKTTRPRLGSQ